MRTVTVKAASAARVPVGAASAALVPVVDPVAQLIALDKAEASTIGQLGQIAIDMGIIVLAEAPIGATDSELKLARLADASGISLNILRQRRFVVSRIGPAARAHPRFLVAARYASYEVIAGVADEAERERLLDMIHNEPAPDGAERWKRDTLLERMGRQPRHPTPAMQVTAVVSDPMLAQQAFHQILEAMPAEERLDLVTQQLATEDVQQELDAGTRRALMTSVWTGARLSDPGSNEPTEKPGPKLSEVGEVLLELGEQVEKWALHLESPIVLDLLGACDGVDRLRRVAARGKLERLARAAAHAAVLLDDPETVEPDVYDAEFGPARLRLASAS
jgi:hypothetical protein